MSSENYQESNYSQVTETWEIYKELVHPNKTVLIPGPSASPSLDATLLFFATTYRGKILVVDPKDTDDKAELEERRRLIGPIKGFGNIRNYLHMLAVLKEKVGIHIETEPEWLGQTSSLTSILNLGGLSLPAGSIDYVIDHNTSGSIAEAIGQEQRNASFRETKGERDFLNTVYSQYANILPKGGIAFIAVPHIMNANERIQLLEARGFSVSQRRITDRLSIPASDITYSNLQNLSMQNDVEGSLAQWFLMSNSGRRNNNTINLLPFHYQCPQMLIASKN